MRPAVNVGLSVSRVGGDAQTSAMKQSAGSLRVDLAQYREMEVFTQFSSDLDDTTKRQLIYGSGLMLLLRQNQYSPMSRHRQVALLVAALSHTMVDIPQNRLNEYREELLAAIERSNRNECQRIDRNGKLDDEDRERILNTAKKFAEDYLRRLRHKEEKPAGKADAKQGGGA